MTITIKLQLISEKLKQIATSKEYNTLGSIIINVYFNTTVQKPY